MTLRELGNIYCEKVQATVLGYYSNGKYYYSFYTAISPGEAVRIEELVKEESYLLDMPIKNMWIADHNKLQVDLIEDLGEKPVDES